jgi:hypothetical protein
MYNLISNDKGVLSYCFPWQLWYKHDKRLCYVHYLGSNELS